jgi:PPE-repeat protein
MPAAPDWGARIPEMNSASFWFGPGAGSFFASAAILEEVAAMLVQLLGGHEGVAGALTGVWQGPTGVLAVAAQQPYLAWMATASGLLSEAAAAIASCGQAFEALKAATPTPVEVAENQAEHMFLQSINILGATTMAIIANRAAYQEKWIRAAGNMYSYLGESTATVGSIPPLPPPPPSGVPSTPIPADAIASAAEKPAELAGHSMDSTQAPMSTIMPMLSQLVSAPSQLGQVVQAPMQGIGQLTQLPMQAMQPFMSLGQQFGGLGGADGVADAANANWLTSNPAAGGPVNASLGGGGGFGGGAAGGMSALRGPVSWSSTVNAAGPAAAESPAVSRFAEARAATTAPAATGMGSPGAMMAPLAHRGGGSDGHQNQTSLSDPAVLYRVPTDIPVVTGDGGAGFPRGEGEE